MRKTIKKEVTTTIIEVAEMKMQDGKPVAVELPKVTLLGNVSMEKAQKEIHKLHGKQATVFASEVVTEVYEMSVEDFVKHADLVKLEVEAE